MQRGTEVCTCTLTFAQGSRSICSAVANREPRRKSSLVSQSLQNRFGKAADRRSRSVKHLSTPSLQNARQKEQDMTAYPVEFHRRLEQKWPSRIDQILTAGKTTPPRDPNDDDDENEDEEDKDRPNEPAVVREPDVD